MRTAMHPDARTLSDEGTPCTWVSRVAPSAPFGTLAVHVTASTTLADVRAACALARDAVYVVAPGGRADVVAALGRHGARPCTRLVDALESDQTMDTTELTHAVHVPGPSSACPPFDVVCLGTLTLTPDMQRRARLTADADHWLVPGAALRHDCDAWLGVHADDDDADSVPDEPAAVATGVVPSVFEPVQRDTAAAMTRTEVDVHTACRFAALVSGVPADADAADTPAVLHAARIASGGQPRGRAEREAVAVHMLCLACKGDAASEAWLVDRERALFTARAAPHATMRAFGGLDAEAAARAHAAAVHAHLHERIAGPLPEGPPTDDPESDVYDLFMSVRTLQRRVRAVV